MPSDFLKSATDGFEEKSLAYDLRLFYAIVVGRKMISIEEAISSKNYPKWFRELDLLFKVIHSRVDRSRDEYKKVYETAKEEVLTIINKYDRAYFGKSFEPKAISEIEEALSKLQHLVYRVMHVSKQFGDEVIVKGLS